MIKYASFSISTLALVIAIFLSQSSAIAQTAGEYERARTFVQTPEDTAVPDDEMPVMEKQVLGRVVGIEIGGEPSTRPSVIINQLTFKEGDIIDTDDVLLSYRRLYQIGLFWHVRIRYEIVDPDEHYENNDDSVITREDIIDEPIEKDEYDNIIVHVEVWQAPSWYAYPYETGVIIGDKDIFLSGKTAEAAFFKSGSDFLYWHARYVDPQFLGSHNVASIIVSHLENLYGIRNEHIFDFGERYNLKRNAVKFSIQTLYKEDYRVNFGVEWQENKTEHRSGTIFADADKFFFSEEEFNPGNMLIFDFDIAKSTARGAPWTRTGYRWTVGTSHAFKGLGSDYTFGRYHLRGSVYVPIEGDLIDTILLHGKYETTSGNPPHYQKPRLGFMMRGHRGLDYLADSTLFISCELKKNFYDDIFQGVVFVDMGKGFDSRTIGLNNLDTSAGVGLRADLRKILRLDAIVRVDYGVGPGGDRWTFGIGQWVN